jgi:hypothetical protein
MPSNYEWGLFAHLVGVFGMSGGAVAIVLALAMMRRAKTLAEVRVWASFGSLLEKIFPVASLLLLGSGIFMVEDGEWPWGDGWINVSLVALIALMVLGPAINGRKVAAIEKAAEAAPDGPVPEGMRVQLDDPVLFGSVHAMTLVVLGIIYNMTTKPGDAQAGIVIVVAIVVGVFSAIQMAMRQQRAIERG